MIATILLTLRGFEDAAVVVLKYRKADSVWNAVERIGARGSIRERMRQNWLQGAPEFDIEEVAGQHISLHEAMVDPALFSSE